MLNSKPCLDNELICENLLICRVVPLKKSKNYFFLNDACSQLQIQSFVSFDY